MHAPTATGPTLGTRAARAALVIALLTVARGGSVSFAQAVPPAAGAGQDAGLAVVAPPVHARLIGEERAQALLFEALAAPGRRLAERAVRQRMTHLLADAAHAADDVDIVRGFDVLGPAAARLVRGGFAFQREVMAIYASRPPADRRAALDAAARRYQAGPGPVIGDAAKDMSILYDHPYTSFVPPVPPEAEPHRELAYPALTATLWAARWYGLAVLTPFEDFPAGAARDRALEFVEGRLRAKLALAAPPEAPPSELPLAPAIAPGLVATHEGAASILDNLHMLLDVLADVLVHPKVANRRAAVASVVEQFSTRQYRCVQADEWIVVALRHSIFAQGGPALTPMTARERNAFSGVHGQHYGPRRAPPPCDP
jgi:hypothetical protein